MSQASDYIPVSKKRRLAESDPEKPQSGSSGTKRPHTDFWFDDGNVILQAEDRLFKIHRGVLARRSEVFRDMFTLAQPSYDENSPDKDLLDGCPVIPLSDHVGDLVHILSPLYDSGKKYFDKNQPLSFWAISAMLRLGTKYQFDDIREEAISRLRIYFPSSLADFRNELTTPRGPVASDYPKVFWHSNTISDFNCNHSLIVVTLARTFELNDLIPSAMFVCSALAFEVMVFGVEDAYGNTVKLSSDDLLLCLRGRELLVGRNLTNVKFLFEGDLSMKCENNDACIESHRLMLTAYGKGDWVVDGSPLQDSGWIQRGAVSKGMCPPCVRALVKSYDAQRQDLWNCLGHYFGVPVWPITQKATS